jgi:Sugar (and other) transporter
MERKKGTKKDRKKCNKTSCYDLYVYTALRRLRASSQVEEDIEEMRAEERAQQSESSISIMELICSPTLRAPLIIGIVMQLSQQLSGINAVSVLSFISRGCTFTLGCSSKTHHIKFRSNKSCNFTGEFIHIFSFKRNFYIFER